MRVDELTGADLDRWVARALGYSDRWNVPEELCGLWWAGESDGGIKRWEPSTDWAQGGPILANMIESGEFCVWELEGVVTVRNHDAECIPCKEPRQWDVPEVTGTGPTLLIAMCRAKVMEKFGAEVPDEVGV